MLNRLKQLKNLWIISKKSKAFTDFLSNVTDEDLKSIPDENTKASFFSDGTEDEYKEWVRKEVHGWSKFDKMVSELTRKNHDGN